MKTIEQIDQLIEKYKEEFQKADDASKKSILSKKYIRKHTEKGKRYAFVQIINDLVELRGQIMKGDRKRTSLPSNILEALNSGDGVYRP